MRIRTSKVVSLGLLGALVIHLMTGVAYGQRKKPANEALKAVKPGYFLFPIRPGAANSLSGALGDLRGNHFHAGLDIRTQQREGLPVHAAAEGYVSRIAVFTGGYGNVVFLKHPNGLTTVYGHLKQLNEPLATYLLQEQYRQQTFEIDLRPEPNRFIVKRGDVVAFSGNTGGSGGPHLHFEIRDEKDNLLNPLLFGFSEIEDSTPPYFERIALRTLTPGSRVNGQSGRQTLTPVKRPDGSYVLTQPVSASGLIGLEILGYDRTDGTPYRNGLACIEVQLDDQEVFSYHMDAFPHEESRLINLHMDYATEQLTGQRFHRCYLVDGNKLPLYHHNGRMGRLPLFDGRPHRVTVTLYDSFQNSTQLRFTLQPELGMPPLSQPLTRTTSTAPRLLSSADENTLLIRAQNLPGTETPNALLYSSGSAEEISVSYVRGGEAAYVIDLNRHLPDSVVVGMTTLPLNYKKRILPGKQANYMDPRLTIEFGPESLYDTLHLAVDYLGNQLTINQVTIPINDYIGVNFAPSEPVENPSRTQIYLVSGGRRKYIGGYWKGDRFLFRTRELGTFQLLTDVKPPVARWVRKDSQALVANISDDLSGIESFRMLAGGEWILMQYDYKRALIWSDRLDRTKPFEGEIVLEVKDRAGNVTVLTASLPVSTARADSTGGK